MSEWYDSQKKSNSDFRKLPQERIEKANPHRKLTVEEAKRLAKLEPIQQKMIEAKKNERANTLKEAKRLCKEFSFSAGVLKGSLAEGRGEM